ncbi:MAG TPA: LLM class flavin-dependent oxidoreductase [Acidimicrobiales bacterium]|nr:LLM class flavin-dependent oxidoreductase [Acidimicrobiales bacterium]
MKFGIIYEICRPDPEWATEEEIYWQALEQCVVAEEVGFDYVWAVEHHFLENYSLSSAPEVFLASVAQRTERIRIGHGVRLLPPPFNHPARSASSAAVLDILSRGRLEFGVGRSITEQELGGFGVDPASSRPMLDEVLPEIVKMWTNHTYPGHEGEHFSMPPRVVQPKPVQSPHPPLWMACTQPSSFEIAADYGVGALAFGLGLPGDLEEAVRVYKGGIENPRRQAGLAVNNQLAAAGMMFCAAEEQKAREMGGAAQLWYAANAAALFTPWVVEKVPGYEWYHELARDPALFEAESIQRRLDDGMSLVGTPDKVQAGIQRYADLGVDQVIGIVQVGRVAHDDIVDSLRLFGKEVMPKFRSAAG